MLFLLTSLLFSDQEIQSNLPQFDHPNCEDPSGGGWGEGGLGLIFAGYVPLASQRPNQIIVYSAPNYRPHLSHFLFLWIDPFFRLNEEHFTFHLQYKHSGTFAPEELFYPKKFDSILVTLLKMRPHYSQSSPENATPSSSTSPLASYKEVPPPRAKTTPLEMITYKNPTTGVLFWKEVRTFIFTLWKIIVHCNFWVAICVVVCCR